MTSSTTQATSGGTTERPRLRRDAPNLPAGSAPVRIVHLGVGNFHRAHQAWYTHCAPDSEAWGIAAFTGRRPDQAEALAPQDGLYTLITKSAAGDELEVISSIVAVHAASDHETYLGYLAEPALAVVSLTVTEHGYRRNAVGNLDLTAPDVAADVAALAQNPRAAVTSAPMKLVAGLLARRRAGAGAITILPCDNLPDNGDVTRTLVRDGAAAVDPTLVEWVDAHVDFATSMVDRITPATTDADRTLVAEKLGYADASPVPTEPFSEWVISGEFPAGRPRWEDAGVQIVDDVAPHERRKLWLLNGSHSQLAYVGSARGHETIDAAIADPQCRAWVEQYWDEAERNLGLPAEEVQAYRAALIARYENSRVRHLTAQIAYDGSQKLPVRTLPTLNADRAAGRLPVGCATTLAGWVLHLRGIGAPVHDAGAGPAQAAANAGSVAQVVPAVLETLQPGLGEDAELVGAVVDQVEAITA
ncbi:mannitol dehydrogenase family protein [Ruania halotolerans]|uniref:mannitol dehydrogenase family protein n=1 Tax=Ruania halotolerans TaxID=2897773 RepID=UPI001E43E30E|nr:mannitol dehydrogenase family protein [Ruania halotolerans]UFU04958.1 mannitol dehydrogenase family protein [Ruania halotolerans]